MGRAEERVPDHDPPPPFGIEEIIPALGRLLGRDEARVIDDHGIAAVGQGEGPLRPELGLYRRSLGGAVGQELTGIPQQEVYRGIGAVEHIGPDITSFHLGADPATPRPGDHGEHIAVLRLEGRLQLLRQGDRTHVHRDLRGAIGYALNPPSEHQQAQQRQKYLP